jgi:hypothetical protein
MPYGLASQGGPVQSGAVEGWRGESKLLTLPQPAAVAADGGLRSAFVDLRVDLFELGWGKEWTQLWLSVGKLNASTTASYHLLDVALCAQC